MEPIAIIGMGCRFPGAANLAAFWQLLCEGVDAITEVPADRWDVDAWYDPHPETAGKMNTRWGGFLDQIDHFDAAFFKIAPREAAQIDPQQRLLLEVAWEALEDAGVVPKTLAGTATGVFIGVMNNDYSEISRQQRTFIDAYTGPGNGYCIAANRLSYTFDLRGPSIAVDTACSSSLVAVDLACHSLQRGECHLALAGGVNMLLSPWGSIYFSKANLMAADGRCKPFDSRANGIVRGEGAGVVVLKRLQDALADGDAIYAVIRGSGVNQDGRTNGLTAPNRWAQEALLQTVYRQADISPADVQYVEAHGTGTALGDPIEAKALGVVMQEGRSGIPCRIGSVKSNFGHLEAAAGIAGLIKVALSLKHQKIPPSLHFESPNPEIPFDKLPLVVQTTLTDWPSRPALAGVSSFGFGGTNAHVILAEAPLRPVLPAVEGAIKRPFLLPLSAHTPAALHDLAHTYRDLLANEAGFPSLLDMCYTASVRRTHHAHRLVLMGYSHESMLAALAAFLQGETHAGFITGGLAGSRRPKVAFVAPGYHQTSLENVIYLPEDEQIGREAGWSLLAALAADTTPETPSLALQTSLAAWWRAWGIEPSVVVHATGEELTAELSHLATEGYKIFLDLSLALSISAPANQNCFMLPAGQPGQTISQVLLATLGFLYCQGCPVNWVKVYPDRGRLVSLPLYPFQRSRYWLEPSAEQSVPVSSSPKQPEIAHPHSLTDYYADVAALSDHAVYENGEEYLHWAPFLEEQPGFSWILTFAHPRQYPDRFRQMQEAQKTLRHMVFGHVNFSSVHRVLDIGCGYAADLMALAQEHPHLTLDGCNISEAQLQIGRQRIQAQHLQNRITLYHLNSAIEPFPARYDLAMGFQVVHHIRDKQALLANIGRHLVNGGLLLLTEMVSNLDSPIKHTESSAYFETRDTWASLLAANNLRIVKCVDASHEIGNFLHDPDFEQHFAQVAKNYDEITQAHLRGPHQLGQLIQKQLVNYFLLIIQRDTYLEAETLIHLNRTAWQTAVSYHTLLSGVPSPKEAEISVAEHQRPAWADDPQQRQTELEPYLIRQVAAVLGSTPSQVNRHQALNTLGIDSLMALQLKKQVESSLNQHIPIATFFQDTSISQLTAELLTQLKTPPATASEPLPRLLRHEVEGRSITYPLSYGQRTLWFLYKLAPESWAYNTLFAARIRSAVDVLAWQQALQLLVERHDSLRTVIIIQDGEPVQQVQPVSAAVAFQQIEASFGSEAELRQQLLAEARRPFALETGPLFRVFLFINTPDDHILLWTAHHIIVDLTSYMILVEELRTLYTALHTHQSPHLLLPPKQMADYTRWQTSMVNSPSGEQAWAYWQKQLAGELPTLNLPTDRPRPPVQTFRGASYTHTFEAALVQQLKGLSQTEGTTFYTLLLAAFQTLFYRYTGQEDIIVGTPMTGRVQADFERTVGYLVNMIPLRGQPGSSLSFQTFLRQMHQTVLAALEYQAYPFALLAQKLHLERDPGRSALFDVAFAFESARFDTQGIAPLLLGQAGSQLTWGDLVLEPLWLPQQEGQFDLTLHVFEGDSSLSAVWLYNPDLFDETTIARMAGHLQTLLWGIVANPTQTLANLPLLTAVEHEQLHRWNHTPAFYADNRCFHELFEQQAAQHSTQVALLFEGQQLSYETLNQQANQLAHYLQTAGIGVEDRVAISLERSPEMVIAILGVLKAGGTYIPLDPTYPAERLAFMLADAQVSLLITRQNLLADHPFPTTNHRFLFLDVAWSLITQQPTTNLINPVTADHLAYIIYTSGTTGHPKGVQVPHRGLANVSAAQAHLFGIQPGDRVLQFSSLSFDASIFEITMALTHGATLCLGQPEALLPGPALWHFLHDTAVQIVTLPPSALAVLPTKPLPHLRVITVAGEACPAEVVERWADGRSFFNLYGPTETTIWATAFACTDGAQAPPIGTPIANTQVYLLDDAFQIVPIGVPGELCIGGVGMARGYFHRPGLTAERFIPDPFTQNGSRLYRTGDLARYWPDGTIEFLGRKDHQVKLRGFRIELGDIEANLCRHPAVREALVMLREDAPGHQQLVAYLITREGREVKTAELRTFLQNTLPYYMIPAAFITLPAWPLTPNGKINRRALPAPTEQRHEVATGETPHTVLERTIAAIWQNVLGISQVSIHSNFFELGGHSLLAVQVHEQLQQTLGQQIPVVDLFRFPTINRLARHLSGETAESLALQNGHSRAAARRQPIHETDIAIVGMNGRFPGARNIHEFWHNLCNGVEAVQFFSDEELKTAGVQDNLLADPRYVKAAARLNDVDRFDAAFFGFTPREAEVMDPQHRLFLECAWGALEDAGYDPGQTTSRIGVYAGTGMSSYLLQRHSSHQLLENYQALTGNDKDFLATRVAYQLDLKGPSITVQTACSTSLVAVHLARQSLLNGECDIALAGGVSVNLLQENGYLYREGAIFSPDGHCRAFDAQAQGTIFGSGVGIVVLKRLAEALVDGDTIYAVIKGSAVNNDGAVKVGYTAPGVDGQASVIAEALATAEIPPETIRYIEAHGTGTPLGDPIEVQALTQVFASVMPQPAFCALGAVKTNVGHLDAAAGVTGLIKTVLCLQHGQIPPTLHFRQPNPRMEWGQSPFYVSNSLIEWPDDPFPRRAGVSSFGIGGTNAHVVLEAAPPMPSTPTRRKEQLLLLSAKTEGALAQTAVQLAAHLRQNPTLNLADVAYTLQVGRRVFPHRRVVVCQDTAEVISALETNDGSRGQATEQTPAVVFMFPGQGAQYVHMGRDVYKTEPVFREQVDVCAHYLQPLLGLDLRQVLYPAKEAEKATRQLTETYLTQPALFVIEYALARLWQAWGVQPQAMIGHSIGEFVAACLAEVFTLEDGLKLVAARGRLMQSLPPGAMLAVPLSAEAVRPFLNHLLSVAVVNEPSRCVVAGPTPAIESLATQLTAQGMTCQRLHTSHAFHSAMMEPALEAFTAVLQTISLHPPQLPYISNVTGTWITPAQATDPHYWVQHLRQTVQFAAGLQTLQINPAHLLLEVGPGHSLSTLARHQTDLTTVNAMRHAQDKRSDTAVLLQATGQLWQQGVPLDWGNFHAPDKPRRIPLPTYPFERQRYWLEPEKTAATPTLTTRETADSQFYIPSWKRTLPPTGSLPNSKTWLLFCDETGLGAELAVQLRSQGQTVFMVYPGDSFAQLDEKSYCLNPGHTADYQTLAKALTPHMPTEIVHLWAVTEAQTSLERCFYSPIFYVQAFEAQLITRPIRIHFISNHLQDVANEPSLHPEKATLLGNCRVIPQEYPGVVCRSIDVVWPSPRPQQVVEQVVAELSAEDTATIIAYRGHDRWQQTFETTHLAQPVPYALLKSGGVYLITGGLGGIGLHLAEYLAHTFQARLVLVGRSPFPAQEAWDDWLAVHDDPTANKIRRLQALEAAGAQLIICQGDVTDVGYLKTVVQQTLAQFEVLHGVFHLAGVVGGGMITHLTAETSAPILAPKITGTLALAQALQGVPLDFLMLFSSLVAITGGAGRAVYCAANAFLDAFAHAHTGHDIPILSVNWDTWQGVGMAALVRRKRPTLLGHPWLMEVTQTANKTVYRTWFNADADWVLAEHRLMGYASLAGTVYLEMVRAAFAHHTGYQQVEFREVFFLAPLMVADDEEREVQILLEPEGTVFRFQIRSHTPTGWQDHAQGWVGQPVEDTLPIHDTGQVRARCQTSVTVTKADLERENIHLGPRWHNLKQFYVGDGEALAELELSERFTADLTTFPLHPALFDAATSFAGQYSAEGNYLPLSYRRIQVKRPLPARCYSHARYTTHDQETIAVDVTLLNDQGEVLVAVEGFILKRITAVRLPTPPKQSQTLLDTYAGMKPEQALEALCRILAYHSLPQFIVSTQDLSHVIEQVNAHPLASHQPLTPNGYARPNLAVPYVAPRNETEQILSAIWQEMLGIEPVGVHDNFFELGGDSVLVIQILSRARQKGLHLTPDQLFTHQTVAELAGVVGMATTSPIEQGMIVGDVPLTPIQAWFFAQSFQNPHHWNQALWVMMRHPLDKTAFTEAVQILWEHHDALRLRFTPYEGGWRQVNQGIEKGAVMEWIDLSGLTMDEQAMQLTAVAHQCQSGLHLTAGPLMQLVYFNLGEKQPDRLLLVAHHLISDALSWPVLLADLQTAYEQKRRGEPVVLPAKTASFKAWADHLALLAQTEKFGSAAMYWLAEERQQGAPLPLDFPLLPSANREGFARTICVSLSEPDTAVLLQEAPKVYHTQTLDILLTALVEALFCWTGEQAFLVSLEGNGRETAVETLDLSRTAGWFTTLFPALLVRNTDEPGAAIRSIKEQLRMIPQQGLGYGLVRYMPGNEVMATQLSVQPQPPIAFLYMGRLEQLLPQSTFFQAVEEAAGTRDEQNERSHVFEVKASIVKQRLQIEWTYSEQLHRHSTVEKIAADYIQALQVLIHHCQSAETAHFTPSDFSSVRLTQEELDDLVAMFGET